MILLTGSAGAFTVHLVWLHGWHGLVHKSDMLTAVRSAIDQVIRGGIWISPNVSGAERTTFSRVLSDRETEILREMANGDLNAVARMFSLSPATVRTHRRNIFRKLGIRTQLELVRFALRTGLLSTQSEVDPESWTRRDGHPKHSERNRPPCPANDASIVPR